MDFEDYSSIKITHYVNPHMFWFQYESEIFNDDLVELSRHVNDYYKREKCNDKTAYHPQLKEIVGVFDSSSNQWLRGKVDFFYIKVSGPSKPYILWAIDYGYSIETEARFLRKMPYYLAEPKIAKFYYGGISNIIPIQMDFDTAEARLSYKRTETWSDVPTDIFEKMINEAASIKFKRTLLSDHGQHFGIIEIVSHANKIIEPKMVLLQLNHAAEITDNDEFLKIMKNIPTNKIPRWKTNNGNPQTYKQNTKNINKLHSILNNYQNSLEERSSIRAIRSNDCAIEQVEEGGEMERISSLNIPGTIYENIANLNLSEIQNDGEPTGEPTEILSEGPENVLPTGYDLSNFQRRQQPAENTQIITTITHFSAVLTQTTEIKNGTEMFEGRRSLD